MMCGYGQVTSCLWILVYRFCKWGDLIRHFLGGGSSSRHSLGVPASDHYHHFLIRGSAWFHSLSFSLAPSTFPDCPYLLPQFGCNWPEGIFRVVSAWETVIYQAQSWEINKHEDPQMEHNRGPSTSSSHRPSSSPRPLNQNRHHGEVQEQTMMDRWLKKTPKL